MHRHDAASHRRGLSGALAALPRKDALNLIAQECEKKGVAFRADEADRLYRHTGGVPLRWCGASRRWASAPASRPSSTASATPRVTSALLFSECAGTHSRKPAHLLLMALAIFTRDASRVMLGRIADLSNADRDEGLGQLERLSLVNKPRRSVFVLAA